MWTEVDKDAVFTKIADGKNLAVAIFPGGNFTKNVAMTDNLEAGKIVKALDDDNAKFFEESE